MTARWRIGPDHYRRAGRAELTAPAPVGIVDVLAAFDAPGFAAAAVVPVVRDFYERTADFALHVEPRWSRGWSRAWLPFPTEPVDVDRRRDPLADGRGRLWLRSYDGDRVVYQSRVWVDFRHGCPYMAIEFPTPVGTLVSRSRQVGADGGIDVLTTGAGAADRLRDLAVRPRSGAAAADGGHDPRSASWRRRHRSALRQPLVTLHYQLERLTAP